MDLASECRFPSMEPGSRQREPPGPDGGSVWFKQTGWASILFRVVGGGPVRDSATSCNGWFQKWWKYGFECSEESPLSGLTRVLGPPPANHNLFIGGGGGRGADWTHRHPS